MSKYTITAGVLVIADPDYTTRTFIHWDGNAFTYWVCDDLGVTLNFGRHINLSDIQRMALLSPEDINMIEITFPEEEK